MVAAKARIEPMMKITPRSLYGVTCGPGGQQAADHDAERQASRARRRTAAARCRDRTQSRACPADRSTRRRRSAPAGSAPCRRRQSCGFCTRRRPAGDRDADRGEDDDRAADRQRNRIVQQERRRQQDQSGHGQDRAADQIISPLCLQPNATNPLMALHQTLRTPLAHADSTHIPLGNRQLSARKSNLDLAAEMITRIKPSR